MKITSIFFIISTILFLADSYLCADVLFTLEKFGLSAYKVKTDIIKKSELKVDGDLVAFSGTSKGVAIAIIGNKNFYQLKEKKKDFFVLSEITISRSDAVRKVVFSYDANYVVIANSKSELTVYAKNKPTYCVKINVNNLNCDFIFSLDNKNLIVWYPDIQAKRYHLSIYDISSGSLIKNTVLEAGLGYSGLWPLSVICSNVNDGIYIKNITDNIQFQYRKVNIDGSMQCLSQEAFIKQKGGVFSDNKAVFKVIDSKIVTICKFSSYLEDGVVIKSLVSPLGTYVALATTKGYYVIDLTQKKLVMISPEIFNDFFCWGG